MHIPVVGLRINSNLVSFMEQIQTGKPRVVKTHGGKTPESEDLHHEKVAMKIAEINRRNQKRGIQ